MMNNAEIIKGIDMTIEGLKTLRTAVIGVDETADVEQPKTSKSVARRTKVQKEEPAMNAPEETEGEAVVGKFSEADLRAMKYNDFKKLAASLGVKCTGTRDEIMERIMSLDVTVTKDGAEVSEPAEEDKPAKSDKPTGGKKLGKKKADEPARDEFDEQAEEVAKETAVEDIISALADVDIKATKKNAVSLLAKALRDGLITLDDDDEDEEDDSEEDVEDVEEDADDTEDEDEAEDDGDEAEDDEEVGADSYFAEYDPDGYNDPENMTEERAEAIEAKMDEILTAYSDGTLTDEDVASYVQDNATEAEIDLLGDEQEDEEIFKLYMELVKRTIDNDGEEHEPSDPYEVGDKDVCCGHELKYVKKTKKYVCEQCGAEYEAEE